MIFVSGQLIFPEKLFLLQEIYKWATEAAAATTAVDCPYIVLWNHLKLLLMTCRHSHVFLIWLECVEGHQSSATFTIGWNVFTYI